MLASLTTGVTGLRAHSLMLEVVGNNLANVNTTAFKASRVLFTDIMNETLRPAMGSSATQGGVNPIQRGLGVKAASIDVDDSQGTLETTGRTLDLAIQGEGFFVVNDGTQDVYTRVGTFTMDADGKVVHSTTGYRVMDRDGKEITIPSNTRLAGHATNTVYVTGNLDAGALPPRAGELTSSTPFLAAGAPPTAAVAATALNDLTSNSVDYVDGDEITLSGIDKDGTAVSATFTYGAGNDGTTLGDLRDKISGSFAGATCTIDADGNLVVTADSTGPASLALTVADKAGSAGQTAWDTHLLNETTPGADGTMWDSTIAIFDSQGQTHILTMTFEKKSMNTWDLTATLPTDQGTQTDAKIQGITFNADGSFGQTSGVGEGDPGLSIAFPGLGTQDIDINFGAAGGFSGLTQFGGKFSAAPTRQDGYEAGTLSTISVRDDGVIQGTFTNGQVTDVATLQVAMFANPQGLAAVGDGFLARTPNTGLPQPGQAGLSGAGQIVSGALESSNVDVAYEFTRLIVAQRGFQVNSRTIGVTNDVLGELAQLIR